MGGWIMKINSNQSNFIFPKVIARDTDKKDARNIEKLVEKPTDKYTPSQKETSVTYEKPSFKPDINTIEQLRAESEKANEQLRNLVKLLLERQGLSFEEVTNENKEFIVDDQARLEAQAAIADGGPLSPQNVSDNIVNFAKAISGEDKSKLALLRNAIEEGFGEAAKVLGGTLPEISQKTYDLVMEKLDKWSEEE